MNMDRNTVIGFVLLAALLFVYLFISTKSSHELQVAKQQQTDSLAAVKRIQDSLTALKDTTGRTVLVIDSLSGGFRKLGEESFVTVENDVARIRFSNKGGQPASVELKKYNSINGKPVVLNSTAFDKFSYSINTGNNQSAQVSELYFTAGAVEKQPDGAQSISFTASGENGEQIVHQFLIPKDSYMVDWTIQLNGADHMLSQGAFNMIWQSRPMQHESDITYERRQTNICYLEEGDFDYIQTKKERKLEKSVQWVSVAQQFFNITLAGKNGFRFGGANIDFVRDETDSSSKIADVTTTLQAKLPIGAVATVPLQLYMGPNEYDILMKAGPDQLDKIVNLGRDMYAFVRPINRYIVMPVFNFFNSFLGSMGLVIALLTIFIRLATSPLVYSSYLSGAKMKALRPEIEKLKEKYGSNQQQIGMEQMKLFREAGVNPLGGCIPALLQIPIFFALYSFFNSNIALRGESFLWSNNLASYDSIVHFPFHIWGLGNHLSLFTLTAAGTSFMISLYNKNMTPDQGNPALKYMPYFFPFMLLFIFNGLPSALTWYYTVSNVITLILQFVIQNYIIDHDKILAGLEANRKKPKTKSKWQERLEQMQETQKKMQESRPKGK